MRRPLLIDGTILAGEDPQLSGGRMVRYEIGKDCNLKTLYEVPAASAITSETVVIGERLYFGIVDGIVYWEI